MESWPSLGNYSVIYLGGLRISMNNDAISNLCYIVSDNLVVVNSELEGIRKEGGTIRQFPGVVKETI